MGISSLRSWVKRQDDPLARMIWRTVKGMRKFQFPCIKILHRPLYEIRNLTLHIIHEIRRIFWWTPLFQSRLTKPAEGLYVFTGIPQVLGNLNITFGKDCTISGHTTLTGRSATLETPELIMGDRCEIGWQTTIAVGTKVVLGNNVKVAAGCFLAGYPGHPQDPVRRALNMPDDDNQIGPIVLEDDVWLASGVTISAGVTIGRGTIVSAGSVVLRSMPEYVIVAGNPAKIAMPVKLDKKEEETPVISV